MTGVVSVTRKMIATASFTRVGQPGDGARQIAIGDAYEDGSNEWDWVMPYRPELEKRNRVGDRK